MPKHWVLDMIVNFTTTKSRSNTQRDTDIIGAHTESFKIYDFQSFKQKALVWAEITMRSCFTKTRQRHSGFGESLVEDFEMACPEAQDEL